MEYMFLWKDRKIQNSDVIKSDQPYNHIYTLG